MSEIDVDRPNPARIYDYLLGGSHSFAVDRRFAEEMVRVDPVVRPAARANREFLRRAVRAVQGLGIRQFLDLGAGLPTMGNVHEIAQREDPTARVLYVDNDPVAVAHSRNIIEREHIAHVTAEQADARDVDTVLELAGRDLDLSEPVAVLMVALLHFVPDSDRPVELVARYRDAVAPGSALALTHVTRDGQGEHVTAVYEAYRSRSTSRLVDRSRDQVAELLAGWEPLAPGISWVPSWRPDGPAGPFAGEPATSGIYAAVGVRTA
ncbi:SAM-dependent methyltransferase [Actinoalloteichus spitiensis]|uniref:SAM-dependent methyltransferase n=1 Tax=Actinoalloteichus spitiensis TaxID=252394 RepID=UPI00037AEBD5|nr:SAM-dependent methyltransferase [Actinoalloteichus spitiensis]